MTRAMKETRNLWSILYKSAGWDNLTKKQKLIAVWFSLSLSALLGFGGGSLLFTVIAIVNFGLSARCVVKNVPTVQE